MKNLKTFKELNEGILSTILIGSSLFMFVLELIKKISEKKSSKEKYFQKRFYNNLSHFLDNFEEELKDDPNVKLYVLSDSYVIDSEMTRIKIFKESKELIMSIFGEDFYMNLTQQEYDDLEKKIIREYEKN